VLFALSRRERVAVRVFSNLEKHLTTIYPLTLTLSRRERGPVHGEDS